MILGIRNFKSYSNNEIEDSVFDAMLRLYDRLHRDGIEQVARMVFSEFEIKGWTYVSERLVQAYIEFCAETFEQSLT